MDHRKSDVKDLCEAADRAMAGEQRLIQASEELLDRVRQVAHLVDQRIRHVLESQGEGN